MVKYEIRDEIIILHDGLKILIYSKRYGLKYVNLFKNTNVITIIINFHLFILFSSLESFFMSL